MLNHRKFLLTYLSTKSTLLAISSTTNKLIGRTIDLLPIYCADFVLLLILMFVLIHINYKSFSQSGIHHSLHEVKKLLEIGYNYNNGQFCMKSAS